MEGKKKMEATAFHILFCDKIFRPPFFVLVRGPKRPRYPHRFERKERIIWARGGTAKSMERKPSQARRLAVLKMEGKKTRETTAFPF